MPRRLPLDGTDGLFCLEVDTLPGMTATSWVPERVAMPT